jgi:hypothetical protein
LGGSPADVSNWRKYPMKRLRLSIATLLFIVALMAANLAWYRQVSPYWYLGRGLDPGVIGMLDVLSVGAFNLLRDRGRHSHFLVGFELFGLLALVVYVVLCVLAPVIVNFISKIFMSLAALILLLPVLVMGRPEGGSFLEWLLILLTLTMPQLIVAWIGGRWWSNQAKRRIDRVANPTA